MEDLVDEQSDAAVHAETGFPIAAVYRPSQGTRTDDGHIGEPGEYPYTRHIYKDGYRSRRWAPSLYSGFGTAADANERFRYLLAEGNGRANCAVDLPTQIGLDSDDVSAKGEVGRVGVAIDSLRDFEVMFRGVPLNETPVSFNVNTVAPIFIAMLIATAKKQGVAAESLRGTIANDILHEYVCRGTWRYPPEASLRLAADVAEFATEHMPRFYPFNIRSILLHESGAHPGQEIGITFAIACRYIDELLARGMLVDEFASRMSFFFGVGLHFFEEAAKFRAARRLWSSIIRDRYGSEQSSSQKLRITSVAPSGSHFTAADPELNLVRGTLGVLSGALGGVQAMLGTTIDEAYDIPTERTQTLALRTQQIVALESDLCATADPLGGSYFVEAMTDQIEASARIEMDKFGGASGIVDAIVRGQPQSELADRSYTLAREFQSGARPKVGVNVHQSGNEEDLRLHEPNPNLHDEQSAALAVLREERDHDDWSDSLEEVRMKAVTGENILPSLVTAVEAYATVGEISQVLEDVFGVFQQPAAI